MEMFTCAYCNSEIESGSWFCDQCGKEILLCETCHLPGRDQWCEEDGGALVAAKSLTPTASTVSPTPVAASPAVATATKLRLINGSLNLSIDIQPGSILGRTSGPYISSTGTLSAISGKHLSFQYDIVKGWSCTDLGSSNGTKYSNINSAWQQTPKLSPNTPVKLENKAYLLIANVEFLVQIEDDSPATTQRI